MSNFRKDFRDYYKRHIKPLPGEPEVTYEEFQKMSKLNQWGVIVKFFSSKGYELTIYHRERRKWCYRVAGRMNMNSWYHDSPEEAIQKCIAIVIYEYYKI